MLNTRPVSSGLKDVKNNNNNENLHITTREERQDWFANFCRFFGLHVDPVRSNVNLSKHQLGAFLNKPVDSIDFASSASAPSNVARITPDYQKAANDDADWNASKPPFHFDAPDATSESALIKGETWDNYPETVDTNTNTDTGADLDTDPKANDTPAHASQPAPQQTLRLVA